MNTLWLYVHIYIYVHNEQILGCMHIHPHLATFAKAH